MLSLIVGLTWFNTQTQMKKNEEMNKWFQYKREFCSETVFCSEKSKQDMLLFVIIISQSFGILNIKAEWLLVGAAGLCELNLEWN